MVRQYLNNMIDGLERKLQILDNLTMLTEQQQSIVSKETPDWDAFDQTVDKKAELIDELTALDDGFSAIFDRIKDEALANKELYKEEIRRLQDGIRKVTDKSTSLMALEERTRKKVTDGMSEQRQKLKQNKVSSKVASNYYKSMSRINYVDPQLMDQKK